MFDGELLELDASVISNNDDLLIKDGMSIRKVIDKALEPLRLSADAEQNIKVKLRLNSRKHKDKSLMY